MRSRHTGNSSQECVIRVVLFHFRNILSPNTPIWMSHGAPSPNQKNRIRPEGGGAEGVVVLGVVYAGKQLGESAQKTAHVSTNETPLVKSNF